MSQDAIVIIGSGMAGISLARELRRLNKEIPLSLVTADDGSFYPKPGISNALAAGKTAAQLVLTPGVKLAEQLGMQLHAHTQVTAIDCAGKRLLTNQGEITYGRLVLAVGAHPFRLPLQGSAAADVLSINSLADYAAFRSRLEGRQRVAILGGGLIGCEFANDLRLADYAVDLFDTGDYPLKRLLPTQAGAYFKAGLEAAGITFHGECSINRVEKNAGSYQLFDTQGQAYAADLVLSAVGLQPALELAKAAELATQRGIVVDRHLQTSDANIYALGDCAEVAGLVLPFVLPIMQCARALATTLSGTPTAVSYPAMPVVVKTPACAAVVNPPAAGSVGQWHEEAVPGGWRARFLNEKQELLGYALLGEASKERQALTPLLPGLLP